MSEQPNNEQLMRMGIAAAREKNAEGARFYFERVLNNNGEDERAWLWMASIAQTESDRRRFLETVIKINPHNQKASQFLAEMESGHSRGQSMTLRTGLIFLAALLVLVVVAAVIAITLSHAG